MSKENVEMTGAAGKEVDSHPIPDVEQDALIKGDAVKLHDVSTEVVDESGPSNKCTQYITSIQSHIVNCITQNKSLIKKIFLVTLALLYCAFLITACYMNLKRATVLLVLTALIIAWLLFKVLHKLLAERFMNNFWIPIKRTLQPKWSIIKWVAIVAVVLVVIVLVAVIIGKRTNQYRGLAGLAFFITVLFVSSNNPSKVNWRPVLWGMLLNFTFAIVILKTKAGLALFEILAKQVTTFLGYTAKGAGFIFSSYDNSYDYSTVFAFSILPTIIFFSCVISLLYYIGVMQAIIEKIAKVMQITMGTSATESLSCAGNIFVGQTEAPILVRPFLNDMTKSELTAVMTGGFATIAGGVLAAFIGMGIDPVHLIAASVMNAPMALAVSKLTYPETEEPVYVQGAKIQFAKPTEQNMIEAAAAGASQSIGLVANIAANLIAFLSLLAFLNAALQWIGTFVDYPQLSFELICSYLFWVIAFLMGVESKDCGTVAELIGTKIMINEFIAYEKLGDIIRNKETCTLPYISKKSEIIATYALCGFANLSSIGIQLGGIGAMAPARRADLARLVLRALIAGAVATLMTACLAGILITDYDDMDNMCAANSTTTLAANTTTPLATASTLP